MPGPARAGALIYAKDMNRLAVFYEAVLGMRTLHATAELMVIESADFQMVLHALPPAYAERVQITTPPQPREDTALKLFFTVESLAEARERATALGGIVFDDEWAGPRFRVRNACDPEGNVFQLREFFA